MPLLVAAAAVPEPWLLATTSFKLRAMIVGGSIGSGVNGVGSGGSGSGGVGPGGSGVGSGVGPGGSGVGSGGIGSGGVGSGGSADGSGVGCTGADPLVVEPLNTGGWRDPRLRGSSKLSVALEPVLNCLGAAVAPNPEALDVANVAGRMSSLDEVLRIGVPVLIWRICSSGLIGMRPTPV